MTSLALGGLLNARHLQSGAQKHEIRSDVNFHVDLHQTDAGWRFALSLRGKTHYHRRRRRRRRRRRHHHHHHHHHHHNYLHRHHHHRRRRRHRRHHHHHHNHHQDLHLKLADQSPQLWAPSVYAMSLAIVLQSSGKEPVSKPKARALRGEPCLGRGFDPGVSEASALGSCIL